MLSKQPYRGSFPVDIVRNMWIGGYLSPEDARGQIAVATTTLYRDSESDQLRSRLAYEAVRRVREQGHELVVVDGGSSDDFLGRVKELGVILEREVPGGKGVGIRQAIRIAYETGKPVVTWTELEKYRLVEDYHRMITPLLLEQAASIVPFRDWESLKSYPDQQWLTEVAGGLVVQHLIGYYLDLWFGPKFWRREVTPYYLEVFDDLRKRLELPDLWDAIIIPSILMYYDDLAVGDVDSSYRHPEKQTELESENIVFDQKRTFQLDSLTTSIKKVADYMGIKKST